MVTWFEDMEVTRFLLLRHPPSMEMEKEWLDRMARNPDDVVWVIEHKGQPVGTTALHMIDWKNGFATTGTVIGDKGVGKRPWPRAYAAARTVCVHAASAAQAQVGVYRRERGQRQSPGGGRLPRGWPASG